MGVAIKEGVVHGIVKFVPLFLEVALQPGLCGVCIMCSLTELVGQMWLE